MNGGDGAGTAAGGGAATLFAGGGINGGGGAGADAGGAGPGFTGATGCAGGGASGAGGVTAPLPGFTLTGFFVSPALPLGVGAAFPLVPHCGGSAVCAHIGTHTNKATAKIALRMKRIVVRQQANYCTTTLTPDELDAPSNVSPPYFATTG